MATASHGTVMAFRWTWLLCAHYPLSANDTSWGAFSLVPSFSSSSVLPAQDRGQGGGCLRVICNLLSRIPGTMCEETEPDNQWGWFLLWHGSLSSVGVLENFYISSLDWSIFHTSNFSTQIKMMKCGGDLRK